MIGRYGFHIPFVLLFAALAFVLLLTNLNGRRL